MIIDLLMANIGENYAHIEVSFFYVFWKVIICHYFLQYFLTEDMN